MYKICYNDKVIKLAHTNIESHLHPTDKEHLVVHYPGKVKYILQYLDNLEKNPNLKYIYVLSPNVKRLKNDFFSQFKIVKAAGGLVINENGQVLLIFRRGHWDLPKGKMEIGESKKNSAIREVKEETGISKIKVLHKLSETYHIYRGRGAKKWILKPTFWYLMYTRDTNLIPQVEEDIELASWNKVTPSSIRELRPIYANIVDVLKEYTIISNELEL